MNLKLLSVFTLPALLTIGCGDDEDPTRVGNIVQVATEGGLTRLVSTATIARLDTTLATGGPFTVFAPTNAAFDAIPGLSDVKPSVLANILLHHVLDGRRDSTAISGLTSTTSLANLALAVDTSTTPVQVGGARLSTLLDVSASNGIIHVVDDVIVPPTILKVVQDTSNLQSLETAIGNASEPVQGAVQPDTLMGTAPITVFAPTNEAFTNANIDPSQLTAADLDPVLSRHVVAGQLTSVGTSTTVTAVDGSRIKVATSTTSGGLTVTDGANNVRNVVGKPLRTLTGVVYVVDGVLLPTP